MTRRGNIRKDSKYELVHSQSSENNLTDSLKDMSLKRSRLPKPEDALKELRPVLGDWDSMVLSPRSALDKEEDECTRLILQKLVSIQEKGQFEPFSLFN